MSDIQNQVDKLDWDSRPMIRKRISPADRALTAEQVKAYQAGQLQVEPAVIVNAPAALQDNGPSIAAAPIVPEQAAIPIPAVVPAAPLAPSPAAPPTQAAAPTSPAYPSKVNERISRLWGERADANDRAARAEAQLADLSRKLDSFMQTRPPQSSPEAPYTNQFGSSQGFSHSPASPPQSDYVSRAEMQATVERIERATMETIDLRNAHLSSAAEAARDFPDVFSNDDLRQAASSILARDPALQRDAHGPYKAAALARGLYGFESRSPSAQNPVDAVRKQVLSGLGTSVPEGSGAPTPQHLAQLAFDRAKATQDIQDWATFMRIARGQA